MHSDRDKMFFPFGSTGATHQAFPQHGIRNVRPHHVEPHPLPIGTVAGVQGPVPKHQKDGHAVGHCVCSDPPGEKSYTVTDLNDKGM